VRVLHGRTELGSVDEATFQLKAGDETVLLLGGRSWRVVHMDWAKREAYVEPIQIPGRSLWLGESLPLSYALCQAQKRVLLGTDAGLRLTRRAKDQMSEIRERFPWLTPDATTLERVSSSRARWWTFGGLKANAALADHLGKEGCAVLSRDNLALTLDVTAGLPRLQSLLPTPEQAAHLHPTSLAAEALESLKFAFCTPKALCLAALRQRLSDPWGAAEIVGLRVTVAGTTQTPIPYG
jgi:ATP-dependent helicase Lhr and Lhr-like helicase